MFRFLLCIFIFSLLAFKSSWAQSEKKIKLSGIVLEADSIKAVPYTNVQVNHTKRGVISNANGLFSIEINLNDTLVFSSVGFKTTFFIARDSLNGTSYSIIQKMPRDTILLNPVEVTSWPSLSMFNEAFTKEFGFDQEYSTALQNSNPSEPVMEFSTDINPRSYMEIRGNKYTSVYENSSIPLNNVLNPKRWDKLVDDWKKGKHQ